MALVSSSETNVDRNRLKAIDSSAWPISRMFGLQVRANIVKKPSGQQSACRRSPTRNYRERLSVSLDKAIIRGTLARSMIRANNYVLIKNNCPRRAGHARRCTIEIQRVAGQYSTRRFRVETLIDETESLIVQTSFRVGSSDTIHTHRGV